MYQSAVPYLESVMKEEPNNFAVAKTLMNIFSAIDDTEKFNAMKLIIDSSPEGN